MGTQSTHTNSNHTSTQARTKYYVYKHKNMINIDINNDKNGYNVVEWSAHSTTLYATPSTHPDASYIVTCSSVTPTWAISFPLQFSLSHALNSIPVVLLHATPYEAPFSLIQNV
eukprot:121304_1